MPGKRTVTQDTFDAAVEENVAEFEMTPEEALKSAVEEFQTQGVDLSGLNISGKRLEPTEHPVGQALLRLKKQLIAGPGDAPALCAALEALSAEVAACRTDKAAAAEAQTVAAKLGAVPCLLALCKPSPAGKEGPQTDTAEKAALLPAALRALRCVLGSEEAHASFEQLQGAETLAALLRAAPGDVNVVAAAAGVAEAAATKQERSKCDLVDAGVASLLTQALQAEPELPSEAVAAVCGALKCFATADDSRPTTSRAFNNGRSMAKDGAPVALIRALQRRVGDAELACAVCGAVRRLAVNEEVCAELEAAGAVATGLQVLREAAASAPCVRAAAAMLRQLAGSDAIKAAIVGAGGLGLIQGALGAHSAAALTAEQVLGLLGVLLLRNPTAAEAALEEGCVGPVLAALSAAQQPGYSKGTPGAQWVQRQACMVVRNLVSRTPAAREPLLEEGAEKLLRTARWMCPEACADVGGAALRDLGFDDYQ